DFDKNPADQRAELIRGIQGRNKKAADKIREKPVCFGVAVSEGGTPPGMPRDAAHAPAMKETPRLVVMGSASWITDEMLEARGGADRVALFNASLSWLRARSDVPMIPVESKTRKEYELSI